MRNALPLALAGALLAALPAAAQSDRVTSPGQLGILATTPSRIEGSSREMNRGIRPVWRANMTPSMAKTYAEEAMGRAGFACEVAEAVVIGQTRDSAPLVEVDCANGGGLVIADSNPIVASDCLDLTPATAVTGLRSLRIESCTLPANVASVTAEREAERRQAAGRN